MTPQNQNPAGLPATRRVFLARATLGAAAAVAAPAARVARPRTISPETGHYAGWPTVVRRSNGQLLVAWSGGREQHVCPFGRVELMRSSDDGQSWSWPEVVWDSPIDDRDAGLCETSRGSLLLTSFTSLAYQKLLEKPETFSAERLVRWQAVERRVTAAERRSLLGNWMLRSTDGGLTWSAPYRVPLNSPHGPIQLSDGRLLYAGKQLWGNERIGVAESRDDGVSWRWLAEIPAGAGDDALNYHELHAVECPGGRLLVHIRNHNAANPGETLQSESSDGGRSWTAPHSIGVWGLPSHLLRLRDGRILMTYGHRRDPKGNHARASRDEGRNWSDAIILSDHGGEDLGYPSTVELAAGRLLTIWYEKLSPATPAVLRQVVWTLG